MFASRPRRLTRAVALLYILSLAAPAWVASARAEGAVARLRAASARRVFGACRRALEAVVARAARGDRIAARVEMAFLDPGGRMLFDVQGSARVPLGRASWRAKFAAMKAAGRTFRTSSNGAVAVDFSATPLEVGSAEATFAFQLDVTVDLDELLADVTRAAFGALSAAAVAKLVGTGLDALAKMETGVLGDALSDGVARLGGMLGGDAAGFAGLEGVPAAWRVGRGGALTTASFFKHFGLAVLRAAKSVGAGMAGKTLGAAVGAALFPGSSGFLTVVLATTAVAWVGSWVIGTVAVKLPILWKLKKVGRLAAAATDDAGRRAAAEYTAEVAARLLADMRKRTRRWTFFELAMGYWRDLREAEGPAALGPHRPLIDAARKLLRHRILTDEDIYAARMDLQLRQAIGDLPE